MRILVIGASGMLGNALYRFFSKFSDFVVIGTVRSIDMIDYFPAEFRNNLVILPDVLDEAALVDLVSETSPNVVINCVGLVKQIEALHDQVASISINSLLPHKLAKICMSHGSRMIHVSTDCVFSGKKGMYTEEDIPDARDLYGLSKLLGEVDKCPHAVTLRTSIIGHELMTHHSLVNWFLSQNSAVEGYRRAIFSGLPANEIGRIIKDHVLPHPNIRGLYHLSSEPISKYGLLRIISRVYKKNIQIALNDSYQIDRSLDSAKFRLATGFQPKKWDQLVEEMYSFG